MNLTYYQFEVSQGEGWMRVGRRYESKETANGWRSFVRSYWTGRKVRLATVKPPASSTPAGAERTGT